MWVFVSYSSNHLCGAAYFATKKESLWCCAGIGWFFVPCVLRRDCVRWFFVLCVLRGDWLVLCGVVCVAFPQKKIFVVLRGVWLVFFGFPSPNPISWHLLTGFAFGLINFCCIPCCWVIV